MNLTRLCLLYLKVQGFPLPVRPIFFNCFFNDFYKFIKNANVHNLADDNTLTTFDENVRTLIAVLESESNVAIDCFKTNKMIANSGKF